MSQLFSDRRVQPRINGTSIMVLGEAPGDQESYRGQTFVGQSGQELDRMLNEAGIMTSQCYYTNVLKYQPLENDIELAFWKNKTEAKENGVTEAFGGRYPKPIMMDAIGELRNEIVSLSPKLIIACGNTALWATFFDESITKWRGSMLTEKLTGLDIPLVPVVHPASVLRDWSQRWMAINSLKRAKQVYAAGRVPEPEYNFILRPNFETAVQVLKWLLANPGLVSCDIETAYHNVTCIGFAWSASHAICIPLMMPDGSSYWTLEEEWVLTCLMRQLLESPEHQIVGQNFSYDSQYFTRRHQIVPRLWHDTLYAQHILLPGTDKDLVTLSLLYCKHHRYWKDDSKEFDPRLHSMEQLWAYNCVDAVKTWEITPWQRKLIEKHSLQEQFNFLMELHPEVQSMVTEGIAVDKKVQGESIIWMLDAMQERQEFIYASTNGEVASVKSPKQLQEFFYGSLGFPIQKHRKTKRTTTDDEALEALATTSPIIWPLVDAINELRSLATFNKNFAQAPLDADGRMRCSFNIAGTETYRWSSSRSAFGTGTNLQNVPSGNRNATMAMPNMRKLFIPDPGFLIVEVDLAGADAQVVAWEADDRELMAAFRSGIKIHTVNAKTIFGGDAGPDGKREPYYSYAKAGVHLSNYGGRARTLASTLGVTVHAAEQFQKRWFGAHPAILRWHKRVEADLQSTRSVSNRFGFRRVYFDRIDSCFTEALAWGPQSTVGIVINKGLLQARKRFPKTFFPKIQVHDSLVFQVRLAGWRETLKEIHPHLLTPVPFPSPLTIQLGLKLSEKSWGDCEEMKWSDL